MTDRGHERAAATFVAELSLETVPDEVINRARLVVADSIAAMVGGIDQPPIQSLAGHWTEGGRASIPGFPVQTDPVYAAVINGAAGTALEIDAGHKLAGGHPPMYLLPAALADAEAADRPGDAFLAGVIAGYEVCARAGIACSLDPSYHPHGVWGSVGAAASVARSREYDAELTLAAMQIAASGAQHGRFEAALEGVANTYAGIGNARGLLAADQAVAGFSGLEHGIERHLSLATEDGFRSASLVEEIGERWELERGYFKLHAACRFTHPTLDAVAAIQSRARIDPDQVASVTVETYPIAARLDTSRPGNAFQARFSVPFAVATRLLNGDSSKSAFTEAARTDAVFDLAEKVAVEATSEMMARLPDARSARVRVRLKDGNTYSAEVEHAKGGRENPVSRAELREKFERLVEPSLGQAATDALWQAVDDLPETTPRRIGELARSPR